MNNFNRLLLMLVVFISQNISPYDLDDIVFKITDLNTVTYLDSQFYATYAQDRNAYEAHDLRDSGFPEVNNAEEIFENLKNRYLVQGPLVFDQSPKVIEQ